MTTSFLYENYNRCSTQSNNIYTYSETFPSYQPPHIHSSYTRVGATPIPRARALVHPPSGGVGPAAPPHLLSLSPPPSACCSGAVTPTCACAYSTTWVQLSLARARAGGFAGRPTSRSRDALTLACRAAPYAYPYTFIHIHRAVRWGKKKRDTGWNLRCVRFFDSTFDGLALWCVRVCYMS